MMKISKGHMLLFITALLFYGLSFALNFVDHVPFPMLVTIGSQALIVIPALVYAAVRKVPVTGMVRIKKTRPVNFVMAFLVLLCSYPVIAVLNLISMFFVENAVSDTMSVMIARYGFFLPFFVVAVMPGFCEEFLFRGVVYGTYSKGHPLAGMLVSAAAFGLMHGNFNQMPYAMFLGIVFVLMLEATDSVLVTMFMHFLLNGANVVMMYVTGPEVYAGNASDSVRALFAELTASAGIQAVMGVMVIYIMIAVCFAAAAFALIFATFYINRRSMRQIFLHRKDESGQRIFDFWLLGFLVLMILVIVFQI